MDGITPVQGIMKEALVIACERMMEHSKPFRKANAFHKIKLQPFFGDYWQSPPSDTIKIRRPIQYRIKS